MLRVPNVPLSSEAAPLPVPSRGSPGAAYMRGGLSPTMMGWRPALRDASDEVRLSWTAATARALDLIHNSGWISGSIDQAVANTVGTGLRLSAMPDAKALGMTESEAAAWARDIERRYELWARSPYECDIEGKRTFGQMQAAAFRAWFPFGEIVGEVPWKTRPGGTYGTKLRLLLAHRMSQRSDAAVRLFQGVRTDPDGMPVGYVFRRSDPLLGETDVERPARDELGRTRVAHVFDGLPGQMRGITPLVPALQVARQFDQLSDAHLTAALIKAVFAATVTSDEPTEEVLKGFLTPQEQSRMASEGLSAFDAWSAMQEGWHKGTTIDVGIKGRFANLFPGEEREPSN